MSLAGPAFTVRQPSGDNLALHHALSEATPGSVLVVQVEGSQPLERALMGDIIAYAAQKKKLAGLITNGAVRDWDKLYELNFSVYCCGRSIMHTIIFWASRFVPAHTPSHTRVHF